MNDRPLHSLLKRIKSLCKERDEVSFGDTLDAAGNHSFAPILLLIGAMLMVPGPADIPGVPSLLGVIIIVVAIQILLGHEHIWVPQWIERQTIKSGRVEKMIGWLERPSDWIDKVTKQRYSWLVNHAGASMIAIACICIAAATPAMEFVPFSANIAGAAIATFAIALIAKDGLVAGIAIAFSLGAVAWMSTQLLN